MSNVITKVFELMSTDDEDSEKYSDRILLKFEKASTETKSVINDIFASLCGNELGTIIEDVKEENANESDEF